MTINLQRLLSKVFLLVGLDVGAMGILSLSSSSVKDKHCSTFVY
ncbi:MAG: hypothetical protein ABIR31_03570 [Ginsengibacter sp.]